MSNKIAVIFDMDGVLVDSVNLNWRAINNVLSKFSIHLENENITQYLGKTLYDQMEQLNEAYGLNLLFDNFQADVTSAKSALFSSLPAKPGVLGLVKSLQDAGVPYIVATSATNVIAQERLRSARLLKYFPSLITAEHVIKHKPHPDVYIKAASELGVKSRNCVVFEDAPAGVQAAKKASMKCIAIKSPFASTEQLEQANLVVDSLINVDLQMIQRIANSEEASKKDIRTPLYEEL